MNAANRLAQQLPGQAEPSPPLDPHDMTVPQRLDAFCDLLARVRLLEASLAVLEGASSQQDRNIAALRVDVGRLTAATTALPRVR